ncbi:unnamed protein product [Didymodactylos carnosus]|uniref:FLYWCH-type domain-containing protein n=1 Tax=Didymodactylos carnosus TaxID=1234261 RepID=A0A815L171_9BILA|nr:unnamed protein product [Didymodactylos carnosus]CAF4294052.1 unnamed protein product [Didymodactylos carnosus]
MIFHDGYTYTLERSTDIKLIFRCQKRDCKGRCHTNLATDLFLTPPTVHSHAPNPDHLPVVELNNQIKTRAATTDEASSTILHSALRAFPLDADFSFIAGSLLTKNYVKRNRATSYPRQNDRAEKIGD